MHYLVPSHFSCPVLLFGDENKSGFGLHVELGCKGLGSCFIKSCAGFCQIVNDLIDSVLAWGNCKNNWWSCLSRRNLFNLEGLGKLLDLSCEVGNGFLLLQELRNHVLIWSCHSVTLLSPCFHNGCSAIWRLQGLLHLAVLGQTGQPWFTSSYTWIGRMTCLVGFKLSACAEEAC